MPNCQEKRMKRYRQELWFNLPQRVGLVNFTPQMEAALRPGV